MARANGNPADCAPNRAQVKEIFPMRAANSVRRSSITRLSSMWRATTASLCVTPNRLFGADA
jgi:hypothetical protein